MQPIPTANTNIFENGIRHPLLYLWDAWSYTESEIMHLYCLAVSRFNPDGTILSPNDRNNVPFHIRHFTSENSGKTWKDEGCFLDLAAFPNKESYRTIWSGSVKPLPSGRKLVAFTSIEAVDSEHNFLQKIMLASSDDGYTVNQIADTDLSSPRRDWEEITKLGYYLDAPEHLGSNDGEGDGPILAWRDPFVFVDHTGESNLFWGGKVSLEKGALVRATLKEEGGNYKIKKLFPPVMVPDGESFTQLELPKVLLDKERKLYYLIISTCNRLYEGQSDSEVDKGVRIYKSDSIEGPWESLGPKILGSERLFGPTVLKADFENDRLLCTAPYTELAEDDLQLTFAPVFYIYLDNLKVEFL
ncbi:MAG: hypothetical protein AB8F74_19235 [Saprospiraceae bacterium]